MTDSSELYARKLVVVFFALITATTAVASAVLPALA